MKYATNTGQGVRICPTCKGTGINPVMPVLVCPKCKGESHIPIKWGPQK